MPWAERPTPRIFSSRNAVDETITTYDGGNRYITGTSTREAVTRTLLQDSSPSQDPGNFAKLKHSDAIQLSNWHEANFLKVDDGDQDALDSSKSLLFQGIDSPTICDYFCSVTQNQAFWVSRLGYAALVIIDLCKPGDEIWILAGGSHPVVLRPVADKPCCYHVVTEAYVHGIMDGEAVRGECPVLPADGNVDAVVEDINSGRKSWPRPVFQDIELH